MTTVSEFTSKMWYAQKILIIKWQDFDTIGWGIREIENCLEAAKEKAVYIGTPHELRSEVYTDVNKMTIDSYGVMDDVLIIEVY